MYKTWNTIILGLTLSTTHYIILKSELLRPYSLTSTHLISIKIKFVCWIFVAIGDTI
jgi:hypothetical protein